MQDSTFEDVDANNLFWTESRGVIVTSNIMYSNVTTARTQWDAAGAVVGTGDGTDTVLSFGGRRGDAVAVVSAQRSPRQCHPAAGHR